MADENNNTNTAPAFDYDKLASIIEGKQKVTEESVLNGYFKQQGLSSDEMKAAIEAFKADRDSKKPDIDGLNAQIAEANARALQAEMELKVNTLAGELGVNPQKVQYLVKMADTSKAVKDGKIDNAKLKEALEKVLTDVPELKATENGNGFKIGANGDNHDNGDAQKAALARAFGVKL